jgi:hypothetical protein
MTTGSWTLPGVQIPDSWTLQGQAHGASAAAAAASAVGEHLRILRAGGGGSADESEATESAVHYAQTWSGIYEHRCAHAGGSFVLYFAQLLLSVNAIACFLRVLNWMTVWEDLGTLSIIIGELIQDVKVGCSTNAPHPIPSHPISSHPIPSHLLLQVFFLIFGLIVIGFASAFVGLMPTLGDDPNGTFRSNGPFQAPFWAVYGEFGDLDGISRHGSWVGTTMMWIYAFLSEVLLVNLLIAMMTET